MTATCRHPDGCHRPGRKTRGGWCSMHAARIERNGDPGPANPVKGRKETNPDRFGDSTFPGYGKLVCHCGRPFSQHKITERCY